jgi:hypothetical protein
MGVKDLVSKLLAALPKPHAFTNDVEAAVLNRECVDSDVEQVLFERPTGGNYAPAVDSIPSEILDEIVGLPLTATEALPKIEMQNRKSAHRSSPESA